MGICDTPQGSSTRRGDQPITDPAAAIIAPLPQKDCADVPPAVAHRPQNGDLFNLREHGHCKDMKNSEAGQQNDERNR